MVPFPSTSACELIEEEKPSVKLESQDKAALKIASNYFPSTLICMYDYTISTENMSIL